MLAERRALVLPRTVLLLQLRLLSPKGTVPAGAKAVSSSSYRRGDRRPGQRAYSQGVPPPTEDEFNEVCRAFISWAKLAAAGRIEDMIAAVDEYLDAEPGVCRCAGPGMVGPQFVAQAIKAHFTEWAFCPPSALPVPAAVMEAAVRSYLADDPVAVAARLTTLHDVDGCAAGRGVVLAAVMLYVEVYRRHTELNARGLRGMLARRQYRRFTGHAWTVRWSGTDGTVRP